MKNQSRIDSFTLPAALSILLGIIAWVPSALGVSTNDYSAVHTFWWHISHEVIPVEFSIFGGTALGVISLVMGTGALQGIQKSRGSKTSYAMAIIGITLGILGILTSIYFLSLLAF
jgi:hypothetical protein